MAVSGLGLSVWRHRSGRAGLLVLGLATLCALGADLLASDLPLLARMDGRLYVLPCITSPTALLPYDNQHLLAERALSRRRAGEWLLAPPIPFGPNQYGVEVLAAPGGAHWLGTDDRGRDVAARLLHGARASLGIGLGAMALALLGGILLGAAAGFWGGWTDRLARLVAEVALTFPPILLALVVQGLAGRASATSLVSILALARFTEITRLVRNEVRREKALAYAEAARASGATDWRLLVHHLLPGAFGPAAISAAFGVAWAMMSETALAFMGAGLPPPTASWGEILKEASQSGFPWWLVLFPGLGLFAVVYACNGLAHALEDLVDRRGLGPARPCRHPPCKSHVVGATSGVSKT